MKKDRSSSTGWRWWASIGAVGAGALALGYFFDPEQGRGRRLRLAGHTRHIARTGATRIRRRATYISHTVRMRRSHLKHGFPPKPVEGRVLLDRVESELFTDPKIPHGRLNLEVEGAVVVLRGQLDSEMDIERVEADVRRIPGVEDVRSFLHVTGTPAPNKVAALRASSRAQEYGGWPEEPPPDVDSESARH
jgi:hypothetical protein